MKCPKCTSPMKAQTFKSIELDRCTGCYGIFCSPDMIDEGKEIWLAEAVLDVGYESTGARYDKIDDINCPSCNVKMDKISDPVQTHIWMEACPQCGKIFLDAGEYTDLKHNTILDKFRSWRKGVRS